MRRIFLLASVTAVIGAWWMVLPAGAVKGTPRVCAPAADAASSQANSNNQSPEPETIKAILPTGNSGTENAASLSPAIIFSSSSVGSNCEPSRSG